MSVMYYFDMDGVIADWVSAYEAVAPMPLEDFNALSREEREVFKRDFFTYEFFRNMPVLEKGMKLLRDFIDGGAVVTILSATGRVNKEEVMCAKLEWVKEHLGDSIVVEFVDKVEQKHLKMNPDYSIHVLIDDRQQAIDAWKDHNGIGLLFS